MSFKKNSIENILKDKVEDAVVCVEAHTTKQKQKRLYRLLQVCRDLGLKIRG